MSAAPPPHARIVLPPHLARELASLRSQRNFLVAAVLSILLHTTFVSVVPKREIVSSGVPGPTSLDVTILPPATPAPQESEPPPPPPAAVPPLPPRAIQPPTVPVAPSSRPPEAPAIATVPAVNTPAVPLPPPDPSSFAAQLEARRAQRAADEAALARLNASHREAESGLSKDDAAKAAVQRNVQSFTRRGGVGGVFEILHKGTRVGQFAFRGWRPEVGSAWRDVVEVDAGQGGDVERAIVRRMIELIRTHYTGDFHWDSHRLGKVVVLSARQEDNASLEDFLMKEFFETEARLR